jgi:hypothetical protein
MTQIVRLLVGLLLAAVLAACGGGGGSAGSTGVSGGTGTTGGTGGTGGTTTTPTVASFIYTLSKNQLNNSGQDSVDLVMTALDANNNPVKDVAVSVSVNSGVYTPASSTTDATGKASGSISIGGSKANRNIVATMKVGAQTSTATIPVVGSTVSLTAVPATPAPGQAVRVDIKVTDSTGAGIPNAVVQMGGSLGLTGTATTDATGSASANGVAPGTAGTYTVDASTLSVQQSRTVQVVSAGGAGIADAVGPISAASIAIVPVTIKPNATGSTNNKATLRAKFLNVSNQAIPNVRVRFEIVAPGLGAGEQISSGTAVIYSDANGEAIADYIAGTRSSPTDGVTIRACYGLTDASIANGVCPASVQGTMTVAAQPLAITMGDNNKLAKGNNELTYIKQFDVAVADAAGNPIANANVSASVDLLSYGKGYYSKGTTWCDNEDTNRNGSLDTLPKNEDINNNGKLEPRKADVIVSYVNSNVTGPTGRMLIQVEYPQSVATWLQYTLTVNTNVGGSEGTDSKTYFTSFIEGDDKNGSFLVSPYGVVPSCTDPN